MIFGARENASLNSDLKDDYNDDLCNLRLAKEQNNALHL